MKTSLFYETYGSGTDLILLHGWGMNSKIWQPILHILAQHFRVTTIDLPGLGRSELNISNYQLNTVAEEVSAIVEKPAIWLGWSLGGLITTYIAAYQPELVLGLINVANSPKFIKEINWPGVENKLLQRFQSELMNDYTATLSRFIALQFYGLENNKPLLQTLRQRVLNENKPSDLALQGGLALLANTDLRNTLQHLKMPVLYILGKLDALVPVQIAQAINLLNQQIQIATIEKASHAPFISHPNDFINLLIQFIR